MTGLEAMLASMAAAGVDIGCLKLSGCDLAGTGVAHALAQLLSPPPPARHAHRKFEKTLANRMHQVVLSAPIELLFWPIRSVL